MLKYSPVVRSGIPRFRRGSSEHSAWWAEQIKRCKEGYKPAGGVRIPGAYYFHLNFMSIDIIDEKVDRKTIQTPWYRDMDHFYYDEVYNAKKNGHGIIVLKARDKGFSYMNASMMLYEWLFFPRNTVGCGASTPEYVETFRQKFVDAWNELPPELKIRKDLIDNDEEIKSGWRVKEEGQWVDKGLKSRALFRCMHNPNTFRGERMGMMIFEEAGEQRKLIRAYMSSKACFMEGSKQFGVPIVGGTSNNMHESDDYMNMWYNAEAYNLKQVFIPANKVLYGFFSKKTGVSDEAGAKSYFEKEREKLMAMKDKTAYYLHIQEQPLVPEDAFMQANRSPFDLEKINSQLSRILSSEKKKNIIQTGRLEWKNRGKWEVEFILDPDGRVKILHHPKKDILNLDIGGVDSYYQEEAPTSDSDGCAIIFRRWSENSDMPSNMPVAMYTDRPYTKEEWYENNLKLYAYYNAKALVEYTDDGYFRFFTKANGHRFLKERPISADAPWSQVSNKYGVHMKTYQKNLIVELLDEYIKKHVENIYFFELLKDLANFGIKNTDMAMAFGLALLHDSDSANLRVIHKDKVEDKDNYLLPTFSKDRDGSVRVTNNRNYSSGSTNTDPLGLLR